MCNEMNSYTVEALIIFSSITKSVLILVVFCWLVTLSWSRPQRKHNENQTKRWLCVILTVYYAIARLHYNKVWLKIII